MFLPPVPPLLLPRSTTFRDARKCARFEKFASNYGQNFREKRREGLSRVVFPFETSARHRRSRRRGKDRFDARRFFEFSFFGRGGGRSIVKRVSLSLSLSLSPEIFPLGDLSGEKVICFLSSNRFHYRFSPPLNCKTKKK